MGNLYPGPMRGTWTPALTFATPGDLSVAYSTQVGDWILENGEVDIRFAVVASTFTHTTASGLLRLTGLPFTSRVVASMQWAGSISTFQGITKANYTQVGIVVQSTSVIGLFPICGSAQNLSTLSSGDLPSGTAKTLVGRVKYPVV